MESKLPSNVESYRNTLKALEEQDQLSDLTESAYFKSLEDIKRQNRK